MYRKYVHGNQANFLFGKKTQYYKIKPQTVENQINLFTKCIWINKSRNPNWSKHYWMSLREILLDKITGFPCVIALAL